MTEFVARGTLYLLYVIAMVSKMRHVTMSPMSLCFACVLRFTGATANQCITTLHGIAAGRARSASRA